MSETATDTVRPDVTCHNCHNVVPAGSYCGVCGAYLVEDAPSSASRTHAFAANPHEHLLHLNAVSTLFPHLPHRRSAPFRIALLASAVALIILGYLRLTAPSIALAALAVPLLYLIYLYEVEVYEDEPELVIGSTVALGIVLGIIWARFTGNYITQTLLLNASPQGASTGRILVAVLVIPLVAQLLMLVGAIVLFISRDYDEALDGFTFAAAGAMGFVFATTLVDLLPELQAGQTAIGSSLDNALRIIDRGLLIPFVYASTSGIIGSSLWLRRGRSRALGASGWTTNLGVAILVAVAVQVGLGAVNVYVSTQVDAFLIYLAVSIVLLLWVRVAIHHCLLAEAVDTTVGPPTICSHCFHLVPRMAFCPHCGVATRAAPKTGVQRVGRAVR